jgi:hypothetical protein
MEAGIQVRAGIGPPRPAPALKVRSDKTAIAVESAEGLLLDPKRACTVVLPG